MTDAEKYDEKNLGPSVGAVAGGAVTAVARNPLDKPDLSLDPDKDFVAGENTIYEGPVQPKKPKPERWLSKLRGFIGKFSAASNPQSAEEQLNAIQPLARARTRGLRARLSSRVKRSTKNVVAANFDPIKDSAGNDFLLDDNVLVALNYALENRIPRPRKQEDMDKWLADVVEAMWRDGVLPRRQWSEFKFRVGPEADADLGGVVRLAADRHPPIAKLIERFGLPRMSVNDDIPEELAGELGVTAEQARLQIHGLYAIDHNIMLINGKAMDFDRDAVEVPVGPLGNESVNGGVVSTFRHEYGHYITWVTNVTGDRMQQAGLNLLLDYYVRTVTKEVRDAREALLRERSEDKARELLEQMRRSGVPVDRSLWMTQYGTTEPLEFLAELFMMSTSDSKPVRESVPEEVRSLVAMWLGFDPFDMMKDIDVEGVDVE